MLSLLNHINTTLPKDFEKKTSGIIHLKDYNCELNQINPHEYPYPRYNPNRLPNRTFWRIFQGTNSDFSSVASGGGPRTFCAPSWRKEPWLSLGYLRYLEKNMQQEMI